MPPIDKAKNTLKRATAIRNLSSNPQGFSDLVGKADQDDLYRLQLNGRSTLNLDVTGKGKQSKVGIQLLGLKQAKDKVLKAIGSTPFDQLSAKQTKKYINVLATRGSGRSRTINLDLNAGIYYVRVYRSQGENRYRLNSSIAANSSTPTPTPTDPTPTDPIPTNPTPTVFSQTWIRQFGTSSNDYTFGTAVDNAGDVYVAGVTTSSNAFSGSGVVTKYKKDGSQEWQRTLSIPGSVAVADIEVDGSGNYYVVGAKIDGTNSDGFLVKYNSAGNQEWIREIESTLLGFEAVDAASGLALDGNNIYITGIRGGAPSPFNQGKAFVAKYTLDGDLVNGFGNNGIAEFGDSKTTAASGISVANGTVYITGITNAALTVSQSLNADLTGGDAFVASFNQTNGNLLWNQTLSSGVGTDYARGIAVRGSELYIVGQTAGTLPAGSLAANTFAGGEADAFFAKYTISSSSATLDWAKQTGGSGLDSAQAITIDSNGKIYLTGETNTGVFGSAFGGSDAWLGQINSAGSLISNIQIGTAENDEAYAITTDTAGVIYVAGQTQGTFPGAGSQNQGNYDVWLAKYG